VVLISRETLYAARSNLVVAEITTTIRLMPSEVSLGPLDGVAVPCVINTGALQTIARSRLEAAIASLSAAKLEMLDAALAYSLGLA
jgi:mRNA interferase MazF